MADPSMAEKMAQVLARLREIASTNRVFRSYLGMGYSDTFVPGVILRNIMENPGWYTQYTPYQAEIAQGRLEALLNFQTMVIDLTGLDIANASLLDEATAAAEAMHLAHAEAKGDANTFFVSESCHPQTIEVVKTRAWPLGIEVVVGDHDVFGLHDGVFGVLLQYPCTDGSVIDYRPFVARAKALGAVIVAASDLMALALLTPPGEWGADVVVGNSQRFGVPMGFGGPHAAFMSATESFKRKMPGRIIGVSVDADGNRAIDRETIAASVAKTNRIVAVEEGWPYAGINAEIAAVIMEASFDDLDAPLHRVSAADVPLPYAANLEALALPKVEDVVAGVRAVTYRD